MLHGAPLVIVGQQVVENSPLAASLAYFSYVYLIFNMAAGGIANYYHSANVGGCRITLNSAYASTLAVTAVAFVALAGSEYLIRGRLDLLALAGGVAGATVPLSRIVIEREGRHMLLLSFLVPMAVIALALTNSDVVQPQQLLLFLALWRWTISLGLVVLSYLHTGANGLCLERGDMGARWVLLHAIAASVVGAAVVAADKVYASAAEIQHLPTYLFGMEVFQRSLAIVNPFVYKYFINASDHQGNHVLLSKTGMILVLAAGLMLVALPCPDPWFTLLCVAGMIVATIPGAFLAANLQIGNRYGALLKTWAVELAVMCGLLYLLGPITSRQLMVLVFARVFLDSCWLGVMRRRLERVI